MNKITFVLLLGAVIGVTFAAKAFKHDKIVSCYYSYWAFYRPGIGKFDVENIDTDLCTHAFYGFADLDNSTWEIVSNDPWFDLAPEDCPPYECNYDGFRRFAALDLVSMISIGGWNAGSAEYSIMAKDPAKRQIFVNSVVKFLGKYGFAGLDLDWEYPGNRPGSSPEDKDNFKLLSKELSDALHANGYLLTAALPAGFDKVDLGYDDIPLVAEYYDFFNLMTYDFHGWFPEHEFTGHNAPLRLRTDENYEGHPGYKYSVMDAVDYYIELKAPMEKMVIGVPTYGRGFQLVDNTETGIYCPADDGFPWGPYTLTKGHFGYLEVLQLFQNDSYNYFPEVDGIGEQYWTKVVDDCYQTPYIYNGPYWLGYDDEDSIRMKVKYFNHIGAGGAVIWSVETDDFNGLYSPEPYPLLRAINEVLESGETFDPHTLDGVCGSAPMCEIGDGGLEAACRYHLEMLPYPGDCHRYYYCIDELGGGEHYTVVIMSCDDYAYDPTTQSCVDPDLPGNELLCPCED